jgi:hypothetical protein
MPRRMKRASETQIGRTTRPRTGNMRWLGGMGWAIPEPLRQVEYQVRCGLTTAIFEAAPASPAECLKEVPPGLVMEAPVGPTIARRVASPRRRY